MKSSEWQARVESAGRVLGAGFLVAPDTVLTCAHVIEGHPADTLSVSFTERPGTPPLPARLLAHGGWEPGAGHDRGDLAVLRLGRDAPVVPAVLAPPDAAHAAHPGGPPRKLVVYGYPAGFDEGTLAEYRVNSPQLISGEWLQLEAWQPGGQPLAPGFSGAAVTLVDTGEVVGMVTAAAGGGVRTGRMMPTPVMVRHWPGLDGLVPVPGHRPADRTRLYRLVARAEAEELHCDPTQLYNAVRDPLVAEPPRRGFDSLRTAALFVLSEVEGEGAAETVLRFAERLEELLEAAVREAAASEAARTGTAVAGAAVAQTPAQDEPPPDWSPILVELRHSGAGDDQVQVAVSAYSGGRRHPVGAATVPWAGVQGFVQDHIDEAFSWLAPGADELIAFALPLNWLDLPVDRWEFAPGVETPLGCMFPLVVTDHTRRKPSLRHLLDKAWQRLDGGSGARLDRVECGEDPGRAQTLRMRLREHDACVAAFAAPPAAARAHFGVALTAPAPALVWSRGGCSDEGCAGAAPCAGKTFLDGLDAELAGRPPAELPLHVLKLRMEAEAEKGHWARDIQLLWDDPRVFADPHTARPRPARSPVA